LRIQRKTRDNDLANFSVKKRSRIWMQTRNICGRPRSHLQRKIFKQFWL